MVETRQVENVKHSALSVEKVAPAFVGEDEHFEYEIRLRNGSETPVDVVLTESLLSALTIEESTPPSHSQEAHAGRWVLGPIYPGHTQCVLVRCHSRTHMRFRSHTSLSFAQES